MAPAENSTALKAKLRAQALANRTTMSEEEVFERSGIICQRFLDTISTHKESIVAAYLPIMHEVDPTIILVHLAKAGVQCALPVVVKKAQPLDFITWVPGGPLKTGAFGTLVPLSGEKCQPDLLIVPLLGFDREGYRLGFGGGYYDRSLEHLSQKRTVLSVGLAFCEQELHDLPHEGHDQRLDWIITDREAVKVAAV
jgi:5-formyltetrahydrofolate cyclo-ligase